MEELIIKDLSARMYCLTAIILIYCSNNKTGRVIGWVIFSGWALIKYLIPFVTD